MRTIRSCPKEVLAVGNGRFDIIVSLPQSKIKRFDKTPLRNDFNDFDHAVPMANEQDTVYIGDMDKVTLKSNHFCTGLVEIYCRQQQDMIQSFRVSTWYKHLCKRQTG